ncbi:MAG: efflux transporter outer membrane subunit [Lysobacterales bacterium]
MKCQYWNGLGGFTAVLLVLSGCAAVGPDYREPEMRTPDAWSAQITGQIELEQNASLQTWWKIFNDPVLNDLIERARQANLDLKIAVARISAARFVLAGARGGKQPTIVGSGNASIEHPSDSESQPGADNNIESYQLGLGATWEMDVFGRVRRSIEAAGASYQASVEDYRDVMVSLYADVALAYIDIRSTQQRISDTRVNAASMARSLDMAEALYQSGVASRLDVVQASANLETTQAAIPLLQIGLERSINRMAVLLGQDAGSLQNEFVELRPLPVGNTLVGIGVPAAVLRQRPDIRRAERLLAAQSAEVGIATAALYPSFSLAGFFGLQSNSLSNLFNGSALAWGLQTPVQWNLFNGGVVRSNVSYQDAILQQRLLEYRKQVLAAIEEVENALAAFNFNQVRSEHLVSATTAIREAVDLVLVQYNTGLTDFNNVLITQRDLVSQQDQLDLTRANIDVALVALYKALGGGWNPDEAIPLDSDPGT